MRLDDVKIRVLMYQQGKSQTDVAKYCRCSRATISSVCNGKSCKYETAQAIAYALHVPLDEIMLHVPHNENHEVKTWEES